MTPHGDQADRAMDARRAEVWSEHRANLVDVAFRMLGRINDAEDIVQDAYARLCRVDLDEIDDTRGWLVTVVSRLCLDQLRSARSRREAYVGSSIPDRVDRAAATDPADRITLDDSVRLAMFVVLERLTPAERAAFVLHDVFQFSFDDVSIIVGRTPTACRQLASRARQRVQGDSGPARFQVDVAQQQLISERFITACSNGDLEGLFDVLDLDVAGEVDMGELGPQPPAQVGRDRVARNLLVFFGPQSATMLVSQPVNGEPGVLAFRDRQLVAVLTLRTSETGINDIHAIADPRKLETIASLLHTHAGSPFPPREE